MSLSPKASSLLFTYGSLAAGATAFLPGNADAATVINVDASSYATSFSGIGTVSLPLDGYKGRVSFGSPVAGSNTSFFQRGDATTVFADNGSSIGQIYYTFAGTPQAGAVWGSSDNWAYLVSDSDDGQRMWIQFVLATDGFGGGKIGHVVIPTTPGEVTTAAAASALVPEPSSLALLSLGASGLLARRRRRSA